MSFKDLNLLLVFILFFLAMRHGPANAQEQFRAKISKIAWKQGSEIQEIRGKTDRVQYKRYNQPDWLFAQIKDLLYYKDRVLIKPFVYARLELEGPAVKGQFTLWGDTTETVLPAAAYEIRKDPIRLGYYQLFVTYGSFVASNLRGQITGKSKAMELYPTGTRYLMTVEKGTGRTFVFVEKGEVVAIASGDTLRLRPMDAAQAFPGGAVEKVSLSVEETTKYVRQIRSNHIELWKHFRPWWQTPWFFGAAVGAGSVIAWQVIATPPSDEDNRTKGTIKVNW